MLPTAAARRTASVVVAARVGEARSCSVPTTDGTAASPLFEHQEVDHGTIAKATTKLTSVHQGQHQLYLEGVCLQFF
jgi:hypothetical protein